MPPRGPQQHLDFARKLRREMTNAEAMLWRSLVDAASVPSSAVSFPIDPYVADFACVAARLIVELDGAPYDAPEHRLNDENRDAWLARQGWRVLRFPNELVLGGGDIVIDQIKAALSSLPSSDPR